MLRQDRRRAGGGQRPCAFSAHPRGPCPRSFPRCPAGDRGHALPFGSAVEVAQAAAAKRLCRYFVEPKRRNWAQALRPSAPGPHAGSVPLRAGPSREGHQGRQRPLARSKRLYAAPHKAPSKALSKTLSRTLGRKDRYDPQNALF